MACNLKDYDGKGGAIAYTRRIKKKEPVQTRCREVVVGMTWVDFKSLTREEFCPNNEMQKLETKFWCHAMVEIRTMVVAMKTTTIQSVVLKAGMLTNEAIRDGSLMKNTKKRGNGREPSRDRNDSDDYKRSRTARGVCFECGGTDHYKAACLRLNRAPRQEGNHENQTMAIEGGQGHENNDIEPSNLGFSYEIEIASGQLVKTSKEWTGCPSTRSRLFFIRRLLEFHYHGEMLRVLGEHPKEKGNYITYPSRSKMPLPVPHPNQTSCFSKLRWVFNSPMLHVLRVEMVINSPWMLSKNWLVQKQTALGKDLSNPFMADNLPKIERIKPKRVRAMKMTIHPSIKDKILAAQNEAFKTANAPTEMLQGLDEQMKRRSDGTLYYLD
nr:hypothetical protein [Tanacetum cinerariifolium]